MKKRLLKNVKESFVMATKKSAKRSGFDAPTIGTVLPEGTVMKRMKNGRWKAVEPKKGKKQTKSK